jgi:hypothetical protein
MQTLQGNMLQSLRAVDAFLNENATTLAGVVNTGMRQRLADAIAQLSTHVSNQTGHTLAAEGATQKKAVLRAALLRDHMAPIARIAAADLPASPAIEPLKMPRGVPATETLAALAYGMAQAAAPYSAEFVAAGLPQDFIAQLTAATDALTSAVTDQTQSRGKRGGATAGLKNKLSAGRKIVHVLDAFVKTALQDDSSLLGNWNLVKRVQRPTGRSGPQTPAPAPTPAPTTTAPRATAPTPTPTTAPSPEPTAAAPAAPVAS